MDINRPDKRGSTPLHWACFARSEFALAYILTMKPELEAKDNSGATPLMLAIKSVPQLESTRSVRALLLRGSDRNTRDNDGRSCSDVV